jgi:hypothetical protein
MGRGGKDLCLARDVVPVVPLEGLPQLWIDLVLLEIVDGEMYVRALVALHVHGGRLPGVADGDLPLAVHPRRPPSPSAMVSKTQILPVPHHLRPLDDSVPHARPYWGSREPPNRSMLGIRSGSEDMTESRPRCAKFKSRRHKPKRGRPDRLF